MSSLGASFEPPAKRPKLAEISDETADSDSIQKPSSEDSDLKKKRRDRLAAWKSSLTAAPSSEPTHPTVQPISAPLLQNTHSVQIKSSLMTVSNSLNGDILTTSDKPAAENAMQIDPPKLPTTSFKPALLTAKPKFTSILSPKLPMMTKLASMQATKIESKVSSEPKPEQPPSAPTQPDSNQVTEKDTLDDFMTGIDDEVDELKKESIQKANKVMQSQSTTKITESKTEQIILGEDGDEETEADDEMLDDIATLARSNARKQLELIDHGKMEYEPFEKKFYIEVPEIERMTNEEVLAYRTVLDGIRIRGKDCPKPVKSFAQSGLSGRILDRLKKLEYEKPTPIQAQALPAIMSGRDVIGIAKTGSGKTLAFLLPLMRHILAQRDLAPGDGPIALIMAPTRELATQIHSDLKEFKSATGIISCAIYGGAEMSGQIADLKRGAHVVVCTPGRMIEMLVTNKGKVTNLRRVTYLVLDEADRMFDLGFETQIMKIVNNVRPDRQTVMFSATFPRNVEVAARKILNSPLEITVHGRSVVSDTIHQIVEVREHTTKFFRLMELIAEWYPQGSILVFAESQEAVDTLFHNVIKSGYNCLSFHAGRDQVDRDETIQDFKSGAVKILIATSGASRGLDVPNLKLVVNYDVPNHLEDYVHRVGRTGRAGASGTAVTFIAPDEDQYAGDLVKALKQSKSANIPENLVKLAEAFEEKTKQGLARRHASGFEGRGYQFNEEEEKQRKAAMDSVKLHFGGELAEEALAKDEDNAGDSDEDDDAALPSSSATPAPAHAITQALVTAEEMAKMNPTQRAAAKAFNEVLLAKVASQPMPSTSTDTTLSIANQHFDTEIEINDFPQNVRKKVTSKDTFTDLVELTGVAITPKGTYYAPGKPVPSGQRKLYLSIEGPSQDAVNSARQGIKDVLEQEMARLALRGDRPSGRYSVVD